MKLLIWLFKKIAIAACLTVICAIAALYFLQGQLIFPAPQVDTTTFALEDFKNLTIETPDNEKLFALYHKPEDDEPSVLLFHGNGSAVVYETEKAKALAAAGFGVLAVEYRGYPGSTGSPSEGGLFVDSQAAYDFLREQTAGNISIYAHSLGTGVAVNLATKRDINALVLEAPFDSLMAIAQNRFPWVPVSFLLRHKFRSDVLIENVAVPILIMHGSRDRVIPVEHGKKLHSIAPQGSEFIKIDGADHNNLPRFGTIEYAIAFLNGTRGR